MQYCQTSEERFEPAQGWILVTGADVTSIRDSILEYDELAREIDPKTFRVELHPQADGAVAVVLPSGIPAYDLANMTGWLHALPTQLDHEGAVSWLTAPGDGSKYSLEPERANPHGDTLVGARRQGHSVRVYLPGADLSETSARFPYRHEPNILMSGDPLTLEITLDTNVEFGNPGFMLNRPKDHDWRE